MVLSNTLNFSFALLVLTCLTPLSRAADLPSATTITTPHDMSDRISSMEVTVNGSKSGTWLFVERANTLYVQKEALDEWRILINKTALAIEFHGQSFYPLSAVPGYDAKIDFANQSVELLFAPQSFAVTKLGSITEKRPVVSPVMPSLFLNYDTNYTRSELREAPSTEDLSVLTEVGMSNGLGVFTTSANGRNLTGDKALGNKSQWLRLETTFSRDYPEQNKTLWIGDTSTRTGLLGRNVYFGGIRFGTNFYLTPGYVSQPLPALTGLSAAPSTVELYVNDVLRQTSEIPTGPFSINSFPILTGSGDARVVVRDLLGRETVIQQSFFTDSQLLAPGLNDWNVEAGSVRRNLGSANSSYGPEFASGLWRRGISNELTVEGRAAVTTKSSLWQIGAVKTLPLKWLGKAALTSSNESSQGSGRQWLLGVQKIGLRFSASLEAQGASSGFRELGQLSEVKPIKQQIASNLSYASERWGSFGLGYAKILQYDTASVTTLSANYSIRVGKASNLVFNASEARTSHFNSRSVAVMLIVPLDNNRMASLYANTRGSDNDFYTTYMQNPDLNHRLGWRVLAGQQQNHGREEAGLYYYGQKGTLTGDVSVHPGQSALRLGATGGLLAIDGYVFATQRLTDSFAVAEVKDYGDVGIGIGSNALAKTNAKGVALIPNLAAYQTNFIRLDPQNLPISAEIDSLEQQVVPARRSGVKANFPVRSGRGALLKIVMENRAVAPSGAFIKIEGDSQEFYVARRGEAFVTGLKAKNLLTMHWEGQQCQLMVNLPPEKADEIPRIGPLICKGVSG
jgi:outer membrane usher protein